MRRVAVVICSALVIAACTDQPDAAPTTNGALQPNGLVVYVVDGDTVDIDVDGTEERVRLIGIDTPETKKQDSPVECFGPEATAFTTSLLPVGTPVYLERDVEARDQYGRLLAYVYRADDGVFVNLEIVRQGYAQPLTIPPNVAHSDEFVEAARAAEATDAGLWASCSG
ncbi:MAG TPA: thermonuclease [Acidimicrobiaceae bacterium]|nr:thermonuclease [Acidimicrobiaceae bacterium]